MSSAIHTAVTTLTSSVNGLHSNTCLVHAPHGIIVKDPPTLLSGRRPIDDMAMAELLRAMEQFRPGAPLSKPVS
ncbi:hypothetical protein [Streptomyces sp. NPDC048639]|uniref:hypothetical protein n=1 Tax=Streptomyces sp. NPDC048639 TaxID=3365581 RepID=UPI00371015B9